MTGILYTQAQVTNAQLRAQVAMYLISQQIENGFYYFYNPVYQTYKALQYDIYTLFNVIGNENGFISYSPTPTSYEMKFYDLVGSLINKIKQFDVYGAFGGSQNPNYQPPAGTVIIINPGGGGIPAPLTFTDLNLLFDGTNGQWYLPFTSIYAPVLVVSNGVSFTPIWDETFSPSRIYGFISNATQTITVYLI